ncbi:MAG: lysophospholipid acyltransferase family protein [Paracoccaceae bacterium]
MADTAEVKLSLRQRLDRIVQSGSAHRLLVWISSSYLGFVYRTTQWNSLGFEEFVQSLNDGTPVILVTWHGRLSMMPYAWDWKTWQFTVLGFDHPAAKVMGDTARKRGIHLLPLSRKSSNTGVLRHAVKAYRAGQCIGVTPDGPMGPHMVMKPGAVELAALCGAKIAPLTFSVKRRLVLKTWDRFVLPLPFNRGVFIMGPAQSVPRRMSPDELLDQMERLRAAMSRIDEAADAHFGHAQSTQNLARPRPKV